LFLDEVGELPLGAQAKLLRVLEDNQIEPLGKEQPVQVDVRVLAATNRNLREEIRMKRFREDLYYRLNNVVITLPPLRDRRSDISRLAIHLLQSINKNMRRQRQLSPEALVALQSKQWPGNIRELKSVLQRSVILSGEKHVLRPEDLQFEGSTEKESLEPLPEPHEGFDLTQHLSETRSRYIQRAMELADQNQSKAAKLLGISPQAISNFLKSKTSQ
jgi:Nif-specific regulatory protein